MDGSYRLHSLDWALISLYALFIVGKGLWWSRRHNTATDYFLAGRAMTWPLIGASLYASNISSTTMVGLAGAAYGTGISVFNYEWMAAVVLVVFAVFLVPIYLKSRVHTMPEFLERRFSPTSRMVLSVISSSTKFGAVTISGALFHSVMPQTSPSVIQSFASPIAFSSAANCSRCLATSRVRRITTSTMDPKPTTTKAAPRR